MTAIPRAFALGGTAGPVLLGLIVVVSAELRAEYWHFSQLMSELGETGSRTFSYSVATSVLSLCALIAVGWSLPERNGSGLFQRLALGFPFLWLALVSWRLWRSAERGEAT